MGIAERKVREKRRMHKLILDTAHKLFMQKGYENTTIRSIAKIIEYSPATLYLYFDDKDDILFHLRKRYFEEFNKKLHEFHFIKDHFSRLKNISNSYIEFAVSNPDQYRLMFLTEISSSKISKTDAVEYHVNLILKDTIDACLKQNQLKRMPVEDAIAMIWSFLHGLSSLLIMNRFEKLPPKEIKSKAQEIISRFLNSIRNI